MDAPTTPGGSSLYVLDEAWVDQRGDTVRLSDLAGRPRVVAMAYTSCAYACPRIIAEMKLIEAAIGDAAPQPGFVLFSIDPARDTPERLADFAAQAGLDPERWTLLTATEDRVLALSVLLGVKYRATGGGDFAHSNLVAVLDARGVVRARVEGLDSDVQPAVRVLRDLARSTK
jgi:protein SCO1/2